MLTDEAYKYFYPVATKLFPEENNRVDAAKKLSEFLGEPNLFSTYMKTFAKDDKPLPPHILRKLQLLNGPYGAVIAKIMKVRREHV